MPLWNGSLDEFYCKHRQQLFTIAMAVTRCPAQAEDAIHEAFIRLFRHSDRPRNVKAYVFRTVRNAAIDQVRRNPEPTGADPESIFDPRPGPEAAVEEGEFQRQVADALRNLSEDERETIVEHLYAGLTFREIAQVRDAPLGTVTTWYQRGMRKLRERLER